MSKVDFFEILENDVEQENFHINGEEYSVYYKCEEFPTELPCPLHGLDNPERTQLQITEIIGIFVGDIVFQIKREADLSLYCMIISRTRKYVESNIVCEECLRELSMWNL